MGRSPTEPNNTVVKSSGSVKAQGAPAAAPTFPAEKRARRHVSKPNQDVRERIVRALNQKLYLVDQEDTSTEVNGFGRKFAVMGTTGNIYNVKIERQPICNCPDCARGKLCKHIIFVMVKVLQVNNGLDLIYQNALLQSELATIFLSAPIPNRDVLANRQVVTAYKKSLNGGDDNDIIDLTAEDKAVDAVVEDKVSEGECPVCFDSLTGAEAVDSCATCRNFIHKDCLRNWLNVRSTCCYCRSEWRSHGAPTASSSSTGGGAARADAVGRDEGYVNLGAMQGLSGRRDDDLAHYNPQGSYRYHRSRYY